MYIYVYSWLLLKWMYCGRRRHTCYTYIQGEQMSIINLPLKRMRYPMIYAFGFQQLVDLCGRTHEALQIRAAQAVDTALVVRNWLFGWYIVEFEQNGADRAVYGARFLENLSERLKEIGVRGSSSTRLKLYRSFYQQYKDIGPTLSDELAALIDAPRTGIRPAANCPPSVSSCAGEKMTHWWN